MRSLIKTIALPAAFAGHLILRLVLVGQFSEEQTTDMTRPTATQTEVTAITSTPGEDVYLVALEVGR